MDPPGRRFAKYQRVPQIPGTSTTSRSWRRAVGDRPRAVGDGSGSDVWDKPSIGNSLGGGRKRIDSLGAGKAPSDWLWKYLEGSREPKMEVNKCVTELREICSFIWDERYR